MQQLTVELTVLEQPRLGRAAGQRDQAPAGQVAGHELDEFVERATPEIDRHPDLIEREQEAPGGVQIGFVKPRH
jgi:hypothetical protein